MKRYIGVFRMIVATHAAVLARHSHKIDFLRNRSRYRHAPSFKVPRGDKLF